MTKKLKWFIRREIGPFRRYWENEPGYGWTNNRAIAFRADTREQAEERVHRDHVTNCMLVQEAE